MKEWSTCWKVISDRQQEKGCQQASWEETRKRRKILIEKSTGRRLEHIFFLCLCSLCFDIMSSWRPWAEQGIPGSPVLWDATDAYGGHHPGWAEMRWAELRSCLNLLFFFNCCPLSHGEWQESSEGVERVCMQAAWLHFRSRCTWSSKAQEMKKRAAPKRERWWGHMVVVFLFF